MQRFNTRVTSGGRHRNIKRLVAVSSGALVVAALAMPQAHAAGTISVSATFEGTTTVGDAGDQIVVTLTNSGAPAAVTAVNVLPSCGGPVTTGATTPLGCANPDPGVFALTLPAVQPGASPCPGTFAIGAALPSGIVPITATGLSVPTGSCTITLLEETLQAPKIDLDTTAPGIQTNTGVSEVDAGGETSVTGSPAQVTVTPATTPTANGTNCTANTPHSANGNGGFCNNGDDDVINNGNGNGGNFS